MATSQPVRSERRAEEIPPLHNGDRLTQPEFHRRYMVMPRGVKAELIGGIVYMASPLGDDHGIYHLDLGTALNMYRAFTPGLLAGDNATTILGGGSEPQPDLHLRLAPDAGGQARRNDKGYIVGPPNWSPKSRTARRQLTWALRSSTICATASASTLCTARKVGRSTGSTFRRGSSFGPTKTASGAPKCSLACGSTGQPLRPRTQSS